MSTELETVKPAAPPPHVTGVILVGMSIAVWWPAFTLGAWGDLFFDQLLTVWVAATAAFVVVLLQPRPSKHRFLRAATLLVPSIWLVLAFVEVETEDLLTAIVDLLAILVAIIGIPFTIWVLVRILWPDFGAHLPWTKRLIVVLSVGAIAVGCWALGANQHEFLTCEDFVASGNSPPVGCVHEEDPAG